MVFLGYSPRSFCLPAFPEHQEHQEHRFFYDYPPHAPERVKAISAASPWTTRTDRGPRPLGGSTYREAPQHFASARFIGFDAGGRLCSPFFGSSSYPPSYTGTGTRGFPAAEIFLGMSVFCFIRLRPKRSRKLDLTLAVRARLYLSR